MALFITYPILCYRVGSPVELVCRNQYQLREGYLTVEENMFDFQKGKVYR